MTGQSPETVATGCDGAISGDNPALASEPLSGPAAPSQPSWASFVRRVSMSPNRAEGEAELVACPGRFSGRGHPTSVARVVKRLGGGKPGVQFLRLPKDPTAAHAALVEHYQSGLASHEPPPPYLGISSALSYPRKHQGRCVNNNQEPQAKLLNPKALAAYLDVPVATLYDWRRRRVGPPGIRVGKHVRYRSRDVEAWLDRRAAE